MIIRLATRNLETIYGCFQENLFYDGKNECIALIKGNITNSENVLCRIHSNCVGSHIFNSIECDCREQLSLAQKIIEEEGKGIIIFLDQDGRGNGHMAYMLAAQLSNEENITQSDAYERLGYLKDARNYSAAVEIIKELHINSVILLTNNPEKYNALVKGGINVSETRRIIIETNGNKWLKKSYFDKVKDGHDIPWNE